ncbi:DUF4013 domain-containing protein [Haloarcula litorea]|uniref:DUF4013 domain-containing protein n=1 Tax=Haloarcula litorea TaxID=3032579 RepID=UPI0023E761B5|nr:DUF4013 domain-containing protein [Halomicroarcula sp. GDY20]
MFRDAIDYPRNSDSAVTTVLIGGVLTLLSVLVVPTFFVLGYVVRALRSVLGGSEEPPVFDDWGDLFVDGLKAFAIGLVYSLIPVGSALAALLVVGTATFAVGGDSPRTGIVVVLAAVGVALLLTLVSLALVYVLPAAVVAWVRTDRLGAAFAPDELRPLAFSRTYATGWLVAVAIGLLANVVGGVVSATGVGGLLVPFLLFYAQVAGVYAIGTAVREIPRVADGPDAPAGRPAA